MGQTDLSKVAESQGAKTGTKGRLEDIVVGMVVEASSCAKRQTSNVVDLFHSAGRRQARKDIVAGLSPPEQVIAEQ